MITDAIIGVILGMLTWIVGQFPNSTLNLSALEGFVNAGAGANYFIDVPALIAVISIVVSFELAMMAVRAVLFIWRLVKP